MLQIFFTRKAVKEHLGNQREHQAQSKNGIWALKALSHLSTWGAALGRLDTQSLEARDTRSALGHL